MKWNGLPSRQPGLSHVQQLLLLRARQLQHQVFFTGVHYPLLADSARRTACTDCSKIFWPAAPEGRCGIAIWGGEPTLPITPHNCHVVPFY